MTPGDDTPGWAGWPVGTRVVVRRWLSTEEAGESGRKVTDILGILVSRGPSGVEIRRDTRGSDPDAPPVRVPAEQIVAVKRIPPRPPRR